MSGRGPNEHWHPCRSGTGRPQETLGSNVSGTVSRGRIASWGPAGVIGRPGILQAILGAYSWNPIPKEGGVGKRVNQLSGKVSIPPNAGVLAEVELDPADVFS
jgi:hypothetical protein